MAHGHGRVEVEVKDHGWDRFFKIIHQIEHSKVKVGVLSDTEEGGLHEEGSNLSVAEIAAVLEFGTEDGHIPSRPFVRSTFDREHEKLADLGKELIEKIIDGKMTVEKALNILGASLASSIKATIRSNVPPPNAPSTILAKAKKGRTARFFKRKAKNIGQAFAQVGALAAVKTLIDTGRMLGAVTWAVLMKGEE